ncbi:MAG TPA: acyltransferase family protein, partial [Verrucomicrobiae bacterium]|nr:acyltransferase family protein [Verrucomicrobiae bacterium]
MSLLRPLQHFFSLGFFAVAFFFILSGFILSHNYFASYSIKDHPKFIFYRFARLWPVHAVAFILALAYSGFVFDAHPVRSTTEELLMVRSWFHSDLSANYPAWSIGAEWFAYICIFPFAFAILSRIKSLKMLLLVLTALLLGATYVSTKGILGRGGDIVFLFSAGSALYRIRCVLKTPLPHLIQRLGMFLVVFFILFTGLCSNLVVYFGF